MASIKITPVNVGNMQDKDILLDAKPGKYKLQLLITPKATKEKGWPMLQVQCKLLGAYEPENEKFVSRQLSKYIFFPPASEGFTYTSQMRELHALCNAADVPVPNFTNIEQWPEDGQAFIDSIDRAQIDGYVVLEREKGTQADRAAISFEAPRSYSASSVPSGSGKSIDE